MLNSFKTTLLGALVASLLVPGFSTETSFAKGHKKHGVHKQNKRHPQSMKKKKGKKGKKKKSHKADHHGYKKRRV